MSYDQVIDHCEKCLKAIQENINWHRKMVENDVTQLEYWMGQLEHYKVVNKTQK